MEKEGQKEYTAIESLYRTKRKVLQHTAFIFTHDEEAASDIVGEAFLSLIERRHEVNPDKYFSYLYTTVHYKSLNYRKTTDYRNGVAEQIKTRESRMMEHYTEAIETAGHDAIFSDEILRICRERLNRHSPLTRKVFMLSRKTGLSRKQVSKELGISENTVRYELHKVLEDLKTALKDYGNYTKIIIVIVPWCIL